MCRCRCRCIRVDEFTFVISMCNCSQTSASVCRQVVSACLTVITCTMALHWPYAPGLETELFASNS